MPSQTVNSLIDELVSLYSPKRDLYYSTARNLHNNLLDDPELRHFIHTGKYRSKDPDHLKDKLFRLKEEDQKRGLSFHITTDNLFTEINDLAGVRLLHLHTQQITTIHPLILRILDSNMYNIIGEPVAYIWDIEYKQFFESVGLKTEYRPSLYSSVHYVIEANHKAKMRCELQIRTLMEEVWGEVSHTINYPHETDISCCKDQLKVLARNASGCTRLVDSIFSSHNTHNVLRPQPNS